MGDVRDTDLKKSAELLLKMATIQKRMKEGVSVIEANLVISPYRNSASVNGRKDIIEALGIEKEMEEFTEEIRPTMEKYMEIVGKKVELFVQNNPEDAARKMADWLVPKPKDKQ